MNNKDLKQIAEQLLQLSSRLLALLAVDDELDKKYDKLFEEVKKRTLASLKTR